MINGSYKKDQITPNIKFIVFCWKGKMIIILFSSLVHCVHVYSEFTTPIIVFFLLLNNVVYTIPYLFFFPFTFVSKTFIRKSKILITGMLVGHKMLTCDHNERL